MQLRLYCAGQLVGTEGYVGSTASGLVAGVNAARVLLGQQEVVFPPTTMIGALMHYVTSCQETPFQPMKPVFGLLPPLERKVRDKRKRNEAFAERSERDLEAFLAAEGVI
jgi:methylenetetrahydrofolate--tRNA-(uracil-5-)-methyltransferase